MIFFTSRLSEAYLLPSRSKPNKFYFIDVLHVQHFKVLRFKFKQCTKKEFQPHFINDIINLKPRNLPFDVCCINWFSLCLLCVE